MRAVAVLAVPMLSIALVAAVYMFSYRRNDPGALSETAGQGGGRRFVPNSPPAGPDAEAMGLAGPGRPSSNPEAEGRGRHHRAHGPSAADEGADHGSV